MTLRSFAVADGDYSETLESIKDISRCAPPGAPPRNREQRCEHGFARGADAVSEWRTVLCPECDREAWAEAERLRRRSMNGNVKCVRSRGSRGRKL